MIILRLPLVEFYQKLLPVVRKRNYKIVLTALAREADSPAFFRDVERYWTSLHDVTGNDILFVFAGAKAAKELPARSATNRGPASRMGLPLLPKNVMYDGKTGIRYQCSHLAFSTGRELRGDVCTESEISRLLREGDKRVGDDDDLADNHTLEMSDLCRFLGLNESQLPCLVFTILRPERYGSYPFVTGSFVPLETRTVYMYVKALTEKLQNGLSDIDRVSKAIPDFQRSSTRPVRKSTELRDSVRRARENMVSEEAKDAVDKILGLTGLSDRSTHHRSRSFELLKKVRAQYRGQPQIIGQLQALIDYSFHPDSLPYAAEVLDQLPRLREREARFWTNVEQSLMDLVGAAEPSGPAADWDFFIAYSSADHAVAQRMFRELSQVGRVFLDRLCLRPGDRWTERIRQAQNTSRATVLLITARTPDSWYVEAEYLHAIQLMREGCHVVVPVLFGEDAKIPYGLEQVHAATVPDIQSLDRLRGFVEHISRGGPSAVG